MQALQQRLLAPLHQRPTRRQIWLRTQSTVGVPNVTPAATTVETPLAAGPAVTPLRVGSQIPEPKPVRIISVRPDGMPISSAGSAGTARASNPGWGKPGGLSSAGVTATPKVATEMPSQSQKPAKHQKREKPEKSANALNAAEAAASSPPTSAEPSAAEQGPANPLQGAHAGRL